MPDDPMHEELVVLRTPYDDDDDAPCAVCGCAPGERASNVEGDGTWALVRECGCGCHDDDDTSE